MRIDAEQFLALTVTIGTVGAIGIAVYTSQPRVPSDLVADETEFLDTERDELETEPDTDPALFLTVPVPVAAQPAPPLVADEAPPPVAEPTSEDLIPGPDVESADW